MKRSKKALVFLFAGGLRPWRPLRGHDAPEGEIYEFRSLPGNVVAVGRTPEEATQKMTRMLDAMMARDGSASRWYQDAWLRMSPEDRVEFGNGVADAMQKMDPPQKMVKADPPSGDDVSFYTKVTSAKREECVA